MKKILIWGSGNYGASAAKAMGNMRDYEVIAVCDTAEKKLGQSLEGFLIINAEDALENEDYDLLLLCAQKWESMYLFAKKHHIDDKKIFCWNGHEIVKKEETDCICIHSQDGEELFLREFFNKKDGMYVDVGGYHPIRYSNTCWAYERGWRGINIEPNNDNYQLFEEMRPEDINLNVGISSIKGELEFYRFEESALNTFDRDRVNYLTNTTGRKVRDTIKVPVIPLQEIFDKYQVTNVDFLDIDVEGREMDVITGIDFNKVNISVILLEQLGENLVSVVNGNVAKYLSNYGYSPTNKYNRTVIYEKIEG